MDCISEDEKKRRLEELSYIKNHPEIYKKNICEENTSSYLLNLNYRLGDSKWDDIYLSSQNIK